MRRCALFCGLLLIGCGSDSSESAGQAGAPAGMAGQSGNAAGTGGQVAAAGATVSAGTGSGGAAVAGGGQGGSTTMAGAGGQSGSAAGAGAAGVSGTSGAAGEAGAANSATVCPPGPYAANPLPDNPTAMTLCPGTGGHTSEGAVWFADLGVLFFSDFDRGDVAGNFNGSIMRYTPGVGCEPFIEDVGTNGLAIAPDGQLIAVSHKTQEVIEFDLTTKAPTSLGSLYMAKHFGSPNDIASHTSGAIFFTDPAAEKGNRPQELPTALYRIDPLGVLDLVEEFDRANGVNFSPDQTKMYLSNYDFEVRVYDVSPEGVASNGTHFLDVGSDGMGVDCAGNIYTTAGDVRVWSPQGQMIGSMGGLGTVTNIAFGGPNGTTMFITSFDGDLKSVETNIPGLPY